MITTSNRAKDTVQHALLCVRRFCELATKAGVKRLTKGIFKGAPIYVKKMKQLEAQSSRQKAQVTIYHMARSICGYSDLKVKMSFYMKDK